MKNALQIILGMLLCAVSLIVPLPTMIAISGIVWRMLIGLMGVLLLIFGIFQKTRKR